jgi:hypothetical protein
VHPTRRVPDRTTKNEASPDTYNKLTHELVNRLSGKGLNFFGNLNKGFIFHRTRDMNVRQLIYWQKQIEILLGGSYYFDGRFTIQDSDRLTLSEQRDLKRMFGDTPENLGRDDMDGDPASGIDDTDHREH